MLRIFENPFRLALTSAGHCSQTTCSYCDKRGGHKYEPDSAFDNEDPAGIGAEVTVKALGYPQTHDGCIPVVVGDAKPMEDALHFTGSPFKLKRISDLSEASDERDCIELLDMGILGSRGWIPGEVSAACGEAAFRYVTTAIELSMQGKAVGVATAPINKEALHLAGHMYSGHT